MESEKLYQGDPLAKLLIEKWNLTPTRLALITWVVPILIFSIFALSSDTWQSSPTQIGLSQDLSIWYSSILNAITYGYYLWINRGAVSDLLQNLERSGAVKISEEDFVFVYTAYKKPWRKFLSFTISIFGNIQLFVATSAVDKTSIGGWVNSGIALRLTHALISFIGSYMIWMLLFGLLLNIWLIKEILKDKSLSLNPLYPDHCGGMAALSKYSLKTAYLSILYAFMIGFAAYQQITQGLGYVGFVAYFGMPAYTAVSLFCFFAPLLTAHEKMESAKNEALKLIAFQFYSDYTEAQSDLAEETEIIKKKIEKMQELKSFYKLTDDFPTWPFDTRTLRQYILAIATPLVPLLAALLQKLGSELLKVLGIAL